MKEYAYNNRDLQNLHEAKNPKKFIQLCRAMISL